MSDEYTIKWKSVDKSLNKSLIDQPNVKAMPKEEWYQFLRSVKEDKHGVQRMHKLILASGDGKNPSFTTLPCRDWENSVLEEMWKKRSSGNKKT